MDADFGEDWGCGLTVFLEVGALWVCPVLIRGSRMTFDLLWLQTELVLGARVRTLGEGGHVEAYRFSGQLFGFDVERVSEGE